MDKNQSLFPRTNQGQIDRLAVNTLEKEKLSKKSRFSDDMVDGIAAVVLIILVVVGVSYWLHTMP